MNVTLYICIRIMGYKYNQIYKEMNYKELKQYIKEFKNYTRKILKTKESSKEFLIRIGVNTPSGELTYNYD